MIRRAEKRERIELARTLALNDFVILYLSPEHERLFSDLEDIRSKFPIWWKTLRG